MKNSLFIAIATIIFAVGGFGQNAQIALAGKPAADTNPPAKADPAAYNMLNEARSSSRTFPADFGGYSADVVFNDNGTVHHGMMDYTPKVAFKFEMKSLDAAKSKKVEGDINSIVSHRRGGDFARGDGKYPITFGVDDKSPIGRLLCLNDEMKSCYRIRDKQVVQVNRTMGGEFFTINVLETTTLENGQFLPRQFTVSYFDEKTMAMKKTQAFTDKYELVSGVWVPKMRRIMTTENGTTTIQIIEFENFKLKTSAAK